MCRHLAHHARPHTSRGVHLHQAFRSPGVIGRVSFIPVSGSTFGNNFEGGEAFYDLPSVEEMRDIALDFVGWAVHLIRLRPSHEFLRSTLLYSVFKVTSPRGRESMGRRWGPC